MELRKVSISKEAVENTRSFLEAVHETMKCLLGCEERKREEIMNEFINQSENPIYADPEKSTKLTKSPLMFLTLLFRKPSDDEPDKVSRVNKLRTLLRLEEINDPGQVYLPEVPRILAKFPVSKPGEDDENRFWEFCNTAVQGKLDKELWKNLEKQPNNLHTATLSVYAYFLNYSKYPTYNTPIKKVLDSCYLGELEISRKSYFDFRDSINQNQKREKILRCLLEEPGEFEDNPDNVVIDIAFQKSYDKNISGREEDIKGRKVSPRASSDLKNYLSSSSLLFPPHLPPAFWNALRTKGFVFLAGLTGTGKTKLAVEMARAVSEALSKRKKGKKNEEYYKFIPVRPDWTDKTELLGWVNPLAKSEEGKPLYQKGLLLDFLLRAIEDYDKNGEKAQPYFLILDEMNLAHIEYYFADFLSVLEGGRDEEGWTREKIKLHSESEMETEGGDRIPGEISLPPNLYIIGTLNTDETTRSLSPKVLDRGFVLEFGDVDMANYPPSKTGKGEPSSKLIKGMLGELQKPFGASFLSHVGNKGLINERVKAFKQEESYWNRLKALSELLQPHDLHFGYRIIDEIALFVLAAGQSEVAKLNEDEAFDLAVCSKVLPKFYGTRARLEKPLKNIIKWTRPDDLEFKEGTELDEQIRELIEEARTQIFSESSESPKPFTYPHTALKALRMLRRLYEEGFASYL